MNSVSRTSSENRLLADLRSLERRTCRVVLLAQRQGKSIIKPIPVSNWNKSIS